MIESSRATCRKYRANEETDSARFKKFLSVQYEKKKGFFFLQSNSILEIKMCSKHLSIKKNCTIDQEEKN